MSNLSNKNSISASLGKGKTRATNKAIPKLENTLIRDANEISEGRIQLYEIPVEEITFRPINNFKQEGIPELAKSIKLNGSRLIHPITLVRLEDIPEGSPLMQAFKDKKVKLDGIKYVISAGERRYRAWCMLRDEEKKIRGKDAIGNKYDTITANILSQSEAKKEANFAIDSNLHSRHITSLEYVLNVSDIVNKVKTNEEKRDALIKMSGTEEGISNDPEVAAKKYKKEEYAKYLLESKYHISEISGSTVKNSLRVIEYCTKEVIDAILQDKFNEKQAKRIASFSPKEQNELLKLWTKDKVEYEKRLTPSEDSQVITYRKREIASELKAELKTATKQREKLEDILNHVSSQYAKTIKDDIKSWDKIIGDLNLLIDGIK